MEEFAEVRAFALDVDCGPSACSSGVFFFGKHLGRVTSCPVYCSSVASNVVDVLAST